MEIIRDFASIEQLLLPETCHFSEDARNVINCWESKDILACPGSGKTTVLIAKLKLISDELPLKDGRGICVLSHTNVAINELKSKLGQSAEKFLTYPNFVGTIQTFVDQYITFPYLRHFTSVPIQVISNEDYAKHLYNLICKTNGKLKWFINQQYKVKGADRFNSVEEFLANTYIDDQGALRITNVKSALAGATTDASFQYRTAIHSLFKKDGLIVYADTYKYTLNALDFYGEALSSLLSSRFKYVFVDEYQDCSELQRNVLEAIFSGTDTVFQKIGDVDQAIYNSTADQMSEWQVNDEYLSITNSNRYSQDIANVLTLLRTERKAIHSERGSRGIKPTLFIYNDSSRLNVISAFIKEIQKYELIRPDGTYKAIGMFKNVSGIKIGDYWADFQSETHQKTTSHFPDYVLEIATELSEGKLYLSEYCIRKLLCRVLHYSGITDEFGKEYGIKSIKRYIDTKCSQEYKDAILNLSELQDFSCSTVEERIRELLNLVLGDKWFQQIPDAFIQTSRKVHIATENANIYHDNNSGVSISFDTVYGVKGETHDATLYLETETKKSSDIKRIMPLLESKSIKKKTELYEKSRRCVYVGFSRPKHLLCLAICESTYTGHENAFSMWNIVDLRYEDSMR